MITGNNKVNTVCYRKSLNLIPHVFENHIDIFHCLSCFIIHRTKHMSAMIWFLKIKHNQLRSFIIRQLQQFNNFICSCCEIHLLSFCLIIMPISCIFAIDFYITANPENTCSIKSLTFSSQPNRFTTIIIRIAANLSVTH